MLRIEDSQLLEMTDHSKVNRPVLFTVSLMNRRPEDTLASPLGVIIEGLLLVSDEKLLTKKQLRVTDGQ